MSLVPLPPGDLPEDRRAVLGMYRDVRRYAVPAWMIEAATERRLDADAAGACAAAGIDLDVDFAQVERTCGRETTDQIVDDVLHLAPDLLRWHLPRVMHPPGAIWSWTGVLRRYEGALLVVNNVDHHPVRLALTVRTRRGDQDPLPDRGTWIYHLHRSYWDARHTAELRERCGGTDRIPFFHPDGRPLEPRELPAEPYPEDPVAWVEWLTMLWDHGRAEEALLAAGVTLTTTKQRRWPQLAIERLVADARHVLEHGVPEPPTSGGAKRGRTVWVDGNDETQPLMDLELSFEKGRKVIARRRRRPLDDSRILTLAEYRRPVDFDLLRFGYLDPGHLHPLVAQALFPAREPSAGDGPPAPRTGELLQRAFYGDTPGVLALLDAGDDPSVRGPGGQTLLHLLAHVDHEVVLPRLLAAGLDVNVRDAAGFTPLHAAVEELHPTRSRDDLIDRLLDAGAHDACRTRGVSCTGASVTHTPPPTEDEVWHLQPPPTPAQLTQLRQKARRGNYLSLVRLARGLYLTGHGPREVLAECYGKAFPEEFFALSEHMPLPRQFPRDFVHHAWRLALPPDRGGPLPPASGDAADFDDNYIVRQILAHDRDLVPLMALNDYHTEYGGLTLCYRLSELPAVFGINAYDLTQPERRCGPSLLAVLYDYHASGVARLESSGPPRPDQLAERRAALAGIEALFPPSARPAPAPSPSLAALRESASRGDYPSMARLAHALYAAGLGPREVLTEGYGLDFPEELFVIDAAGPDEVLPGDTTNLPWELLRPPGRGGPALQALPMLARAEQRIFAFDPDLVPLLRLYGDNRFGLGATSPPPQGRHGELIHCYRLSDLAEGRSTVYGVPRKPAEEGGGRLSARVTGDSLLAVCHDYFSDQLRLDEWQLNQPFNRETGSISGEEVEQTRKNVECIEALRRRLSD
ncbi:ankyrin repeat domain-containing protein [Nonomuraea sp. NPDC050556]|uniref:ankyrin repeat domain-containing protein n=1 Tax=Nonomuraea sp. NPDC050556 TaxID=3364369 RepID=UPI0037907AC6